MRFLSLLFRLVQWLSRLISILQKSPHPCEKRAPIFANGVFCSETAHVFQNRTGWKATEPVAKAVGVQADQRDPVPDDPRILARQDVEACVKPVSPRFSDPTMSSFSIDFLTEARVSFDSSERAGFCVLL